MPINDAQPLILKLLSMMTSRERACWIRTAPDAVTCFANDEIFRFSAIHNSSATILSRENEFINADAIRGEIRGFYFLWLKDAPGWADVTQLIDQSQDASERLAPLANAALQRLLSDLQRYAAHGG